MTEDPHSQDKDRVIVRGRKRNLQQFEQPAKRKEFIDEFWARLSPFLHNQALAGLVLMGTTIIALVWANSPWADSYSRIWHTYFGITFGDFSLKYSLQHWINDLLMAFFFFVVGLEIKREVIAGELSTASKALLPVMAAIGGMIVPAVFYMLFNLDSPYHRGWGIPMATDIAFALGILSLFGKRVSPALKIFLAALAIADDIGAVLVIALFYTEGLEIIKVVSGFGFLGVLAFFNFIGIRESLPYLIVGIGGLWLSFLLSGIHPSVAGVLAAFAIPARRKLNAPAFLLAVKPQMETFVDEFRDRRESQRTPFLDKHQLHAIFELEEAYKAATPPLQRMENRLHPWISFAVMPLFALANAGVAIDMDSISRLSSPLSLGIIVGLFIGKQVGVFSATWLTVKIGLAKLPEGVNWAKIYGASCLAGIGFTMSLFISTLAFKGQDDALESAKLAILIGSIISGILGSILIMLGTSYQEKKNPADQIQDSANRQGEAARHA
ncbi:MAG: Na+/H+ antiporter NhaA [Bdellovibrionales bacterium]|nr:Na+/H+ antiporter NhaA [Bdellovibrionales bacterium]